ncbi:MAG: hypothetical protein RL033_2342 [Pseudomonadota bacterium]|jgi:hypothetical protein
MRRARHFSLCDAWPLLLALACGRDGAAPEPPGPVADAGAIEPVAGQRVVLGTGRRAFEPRETDTHVTLVAGLQGAHHVWVSFRSYGFDTDVLRMSLSMGWEDEPDVRQLMAGNVAAKPVVDEEGLSTRVTLGWPALVPDPLCQDGRVLQLELSVSNDTLEASDSRRWVLDVPPEERPADCTPDAGHTDGAPAE